MADSPAAATGPDDGSALLASFVPGAVLAEIAERGPLTAPRADEFDGVVLIADLSGFSRLASELAREADGMERLTVMLNDGFATLIGIIARFRGDVVKFAGDALIVVWPAGDALELPARAHLAVECSLECNAAFQDDAASPFSIHCAVAAGRLYGVFCGGRAGRWEYLLAGATVMDQLSTALDAAKSGEVLVTDYVASLLKDRVGCDAVQDQPFLRRARSCLVPSAPDEAPAAPERPNDANALAAFVPSIVLSRFAAGQTDWLSERRICTVVFFSLPIEFENADSLAALQTAVVLVQDNLARLEGTLRQVIYDDKGLVLISVFGLPPLVHTDDPSRAVMAATRITKALSGCSAGVTTGRAFCGTVGSAARREFALVSSLVNLAARFMALAPTGGVICDKPTRDSASGRLTFDALPPRQLKGSLEPVPMFSPVNTETPRRDSMALASQRALPPTGALDADGKPAAAGHARMVDPCVGRADEKVLIEAAIAKLAKQEPRGLLAAGGLGAELAAAGGAAGGLGGMVIEGEAGIGKSTLLESAMQAATRAGVPMYHGAADAFETSTPYFAFRQILHELVRFDAFDSDVERRAYVESLLVKRVITRMHHGSRVSLNESSRPQSATGSRTSSHHVGDISDPSRLRRAAPLLNALLPLGFQETAQSQAIQGQARADSLNAMIVQIAMAATAAGSSPKALLVVEDGHWLDSPSLQVLTLICKHAPRILVLLSTRPDKRPAMAALFRLTQVRVMHLSPLDSGDTVSLACRKLGVVALPDQIIDIIRDRSAGHPFFATEIAFYLRDSGTLVIRKGGDADSGDAGGAVAVLAEGADLDKLEIPSTVEGMVMQRLAQLDSRVQLALKVASVIGRNFSRAVLESIHPIEMDRPHIAQLLKDATSHEIVELDDEEEASAELQYVFRHMITHVVSYDLLLASQRRALHLQVAEFHLKTRDKDDLEQVAPLLAFHFKRADEVERALPFLVMAGRNAHLQYANTETIAFLGEVVELLDNNPGLASKYTSSEQGEFHKLLGEAHMYIGHGPESDYHFRRAMSIFQRPYPKSTASVLWRLVRGIWRQSRHYKQKRFLEQRSKLPREDNRTLVAAAECYERMSQVAYFKGDTVGTLLTLVTSLNISEECNTHDNAVVVRNYIAAAICCSIIGKPELGDQYFGFGWHRIEDDPTSESIARSMPFIELVSGIFLSDVGRIHEAFSHYEHGVEAALELGEARRYEELLGNWCDSYMIAGMSAVDLTQQLLQSAVQRGDPQSSIWGVNVTLLEYARYGDDVFDADQMAALAEQGLNIMDEELGDEIQVLDAISGHASVGIFRQDVDHARKALAALAKYAPTAFNIVNTAMAAMIVFLRAIHSDIAGRHGKYSRKSLVADVHAMLRAMKPHRAVFPVCDPPFLRAEGYLHFFTDKPKAAIKAFRTAFEKATRLHMQYDALVAALELRRLFGEDAPLDIDEVAHEAGISLFLLEATPVPY